MSAVVKCSTKLKERRDLVSALDKIGVPKDKVKVAAVGEYVEHLGYGGVKDKADVSISRSWHGGYGDISFQRGADGNYVQISDDLDGPKHDRAAGGKFSQLLTQYYAASAADRALRQQGFTTKIERDGDIVRVRAQSF